MTIYIDNDFKCHVKNDGSMREFDVSAFDGKCDSYVESYRYIPKKETWTRSDGVVFDGEMVTPFVDSRIPDKAQKSYTDGIDSQDSTIAGLMDEITDLCEEIIGE